MHIALYSGLVIENQFQMISQRKQLEINNAGIVYTETLAVRQNLSSNAGL